MLINSKKEKFIISFRNASEKDFNYMIKIIGNYYQKLNLPEIHTKKNMSPWIWINESNVSFELMLINKAIVGFFISRTVPLNIHLHSFFIDSKFRGLGLGEKLLMKHWENGIKNSLEVDTFTLHVHQINKFAASFYKKYGYKKVEQNNNLLLLNDGLGSWTRNCKNKDQWPLKKGIDLYLVKAKEIKNSLKNI